MGYDGLMNEKAGTLTVGANDADLVGSDGATIQQAINQLAEEGGGTVRVLPEF